MPVPQAAIKFSKDNPLEQFLINMKAFILITLQTSRKKDMGLKINKATAQM